MSRVAPKADAQACFGGVTLCYCDFFTGIRYVKICCGDTCGNCYRLGTC